MRDYRYDHVHLRSPDPDATARFFETMFGAEVTQSLPARHALSGPAAHHDAAGWPNRTDRPASPHTKPLRRHRPFLITAWSISA
jgi:catechol 2,3-dioxygenase-like lactoylglutathione lyase family enzyme